MKRVMKGAAYVLPLGALLFAGCSGPPGPPIHDPVLNRRVFLDVNGAPLEEVVQKLARSVDRSLIIDQRDPRVKRPVVLTIWNVSAETALTVVCETAGCRWRITDRVLEITATEPPPAPPAVDIVLHAARTPLPGSWRFTNRPLGEIFADFARYTPIDIQLVNADLSRPVTADVTGETPSRAVLDLLRAAGLEEDGPSRSADFRLTETGARWVVRVRPIGQPGK